MKHPWDALEIWRPINDWPYEVSSFGRVRRVGGKILKPGLSSRKYFSVELYKQGKSGCFKVHVLVCETFHGPKPTPKHEVAHWDDISVHNQATNLRWATRKDNIADRLRNSGPHYKGPGPKLKFTQEQIHIVRSVTNLSHRQIAQMAGMSAYSVSIIKNNIRYT